MSTDEASPAPRRRWPALVVLAAGLFTCALALPRVIAYGVAAGDGGRAAAVLADGGPLTPAALADARVRYARALAVHPSDAALALALARLERRAAADDPEALDAARAHLRQAAAHAPNDAFVWSLLAQTAFERGAPVEEIGGYLKLSRLTGRFEASSMLLRMRTALPLWERLPEDQRDGAARDMARLGADPKLRRSLYGPYVSMGYAERALFLDHAFAGKSERGRFRSQILKYTRERRR
ncbi:MAG: hypothetical protein U0942_00840 [Parvibaculum sp.]|uniref:hypothetical protein n=1 Tax=Parvibaculum sp. TaxID=2024848 RepID=UPI002ABB3EF9|nr:hypothetical protein [Parvibaculum sp.]MDZ4379869.1 hypothetical protein [Parvibaculum sp.]